MVSGLQRTITCKHEMQKILGQCNALFLTGTYSGKLEI